MGSWESHMTYHSLFFFLSHTWNNFFLWFRNCNLHRSKNQNNYRIVLFSVKRQHELTIDIHMLTPFWTSLPFPAPSYATVPVEFSESYSKSPLRICLTYNIVNISMVFSLITPVSPFPHSPKFCSLHICYFLAYRVLVISF